MSKSKDNRSEGGSSVGSQASRGRWAAVLLIALPLLAAMAIVDPFREFMTEDDGWAYARSVVHLLQTGEYRLDAWSAANMPVQIYLAAGLAKLFGYSLSIVRISTLLLLVAGLTAFHALLRELAVDRVPAAALTLGLLASPLVLMLGFTFMSDVQFMSWLLISLWLYVRGIQRESDRTVLIGSLAAACAIGTRQFGMALIGGLVLAWLLPRAEKRPPLTRWLWASVVPLAAALWQLRAGLGEPNFTQAVRLHEQIFFVTRPLAVLAHETAWRVATVLQYLGLSMLPVFPLLALAALRREATPVSPSRRSRTMRIVVPAFAGWAVVMALSYTQSAISTRDGASRILQLWWMLPNAFFQHPAILRSLAVAGAVGSLLIMLLALRTVARRWAALRDIAPGWVLLAATGACLLALHLSYVQLNDTYVVGLLPFALFLTGRAIAKAPRMAGTLTASVVVSVSMILLLSVWMRGDYNRQQAQWKASDRLMEAGVDPRCIGASRHWAEYHGAFDDWLAATYPDFDHKRGDRSPAAPGPLHAPFYAWLEARNWNASYRTYLGWKGKALAGSRLADEVPFEGPLLTERSIQVYRRDPARPPTSETCSP